jgi:hypothetical protein
VKRAPLALGRRLRNLDFQKDGEAHGRAAPSYQRRGTSRLE